MFKKISLFLTALVLCALSVNAQSLNWDQKALYYNECGTLSINSTEYNGVYSLQLWSDPPFGAARKFIEEDILLSGEPQNVDITFRFDEKLYDYILEDELAEEIMHLNIENPDEQELVKNELFEAAFDLLSFKARLYKKDELITESKAIKVAVSFY